MCRTAIFGHPVELPFLAVLVVIVAASVGAGVVRRAREAALACGPRSMRQERMQDLGAGDTTRGVLLQGSQ